MTNPSKYVTNNIIGSLNLINYCVKYGVERHLSLAPQPLYMVFLTILQ